MRGTAADYVALQRSLLTNSKQQHETLCTCIYIYIYGSVLLMSDKEYEEMAHLATSETRVTRA